MSNRYEKFRDYKHVAEWFGKARSPSKGRPVTDNTYIRVYKRGEDYILANRVYRQNTKLFTEGNPDAMIPMLVMRPDDTILVSSRTACCESAYMHSRTRFGLSVMPESNGAFSYGKGGFFEVFDGAVYDYDGKCLNPLPSAEESLIPEVRRNWLRDVKAYKKGLLLRNKLGIIDKVVTDDIRTPDRGYNDTRLLLFAKAIQEQDFSPETLRVLFAYDPARLVYTSSRTAAYTKGAIEQFINDFFKNNSLKLRRTYGVFGEYIQQLVLEGRL